MSRFLLFSTAAVLLVAVPVAARQDSQCSPRDETPGEHGIGMFFDSAGVAGVIEREWNPEWGILFGYLAPDSADVMGRLSLYSTSDDPAGVERIAGWLQAFRGTAPLPDSLRVALMLAEGEEIRPRSIARLQHCAPRPLDMEGVEKRLEAVIRRPGFKNSPAFRSSRQVPVVLWLFVETDGRVTDLQIFESSGFPDWDRIAGQVAMDMEFLPYTLEGIPIASWVQIPFTFGGIRTGRGYGGRGGGQRAPDRRP